MAETSLMRRHSAAQPRGDGALSRLVLTQHQQHEARKRLEADEIQRSVARSYNVSHSTISRL
jgi:chromosomal replication initiation ATPase DnaA